jgi:SAM-dependent methyltransferase
MEAKWYESFFSGVAVEMWQRAISPAQTHAETDFLVDALRLPAGGRVLDVPCGHGRHSVVLAERGFRVTGADLSRDALEAAHASSAGVDWVLGDMRQLPWRAEFDGVFCFGNSFGYLEHEATLEFLLAVSRVLKPGGRFAIETGMAAESILPTLQSRRWYQLGDILFLSSNRYDTSESRLHIEYTFVRGGQSETRQASTACYTAAEIRRMLEGVGLRTVALYAGIDRKPYELGSPSLLLVSEKV